MDVCQLHLNPKPLPIQKVRLLKRMSLGHVRDEDGPLKCPYGQLKTTPRKDPYGRLKTTPRKDLYGRLKTTPRKDPMDDSRQFQGLSQHL